MKAHKTFILLGAIVFLTFAPIVWACSCYNWPDPAEAYKIYDVIFVGEVVNFNLQVHKSDNPSILILKIVKNFKGELIEGEETELFNPICPYDHFREGERYLIYTSKDWSGLLGWPSECGPSQAYSEDSPYIKFLEDLNQ